MFQTGYLVTPDGELRPLETWQATADLDGDKLPVHSDLTFGDLALSMTPELHAPVLLESPEGKQSRFPRTLCHFEAPDGRQGRGWTEFNWPDGFPK